MPRAAILYIGTGLYSRFWPDFHRSAEAHLFPGVPRSYHVATDDSQLLESSCFNHSHFYHQANQPWPLPTLHRFGSFLARRKELDAERPDLVFFFNANTRFHRHIPWEDLAPGRLQDFVGVEHPGYAGLHPLLCPYERRRSLHCRLPWSHHQPYLQGCLLGGRLEPFLLMCETLHRSTLHDQDRNLMARWHDESYWNWFCSSRTIRLLPWHYAVPWHETQGAPPQSARILMMLKPRLRPQKCQPLWLRHVGRRVRSCFNRLLWALRP